MLNEVGCYTINPMNIRGRKAKIQNNNSDCPDIRQ